MKNQKTDWGSFMKDEITRKMANGQTIHQPALLATDMTFSKKDLTFSTEASMCNWAPGHFPEVVPIKGTRETKLFYKDKIETANGDLLYVTYIDPNAEYLLIVFND